ncbi:hypothetical protein M422DRAFT_276191 [Sphaerobolus stellatus SS14]|uniref:Unplaced genomic scaffold SPHSTscaffold_662, whole genome shotgun sequence n=1 Tax=Sphaerobolus stellatus (strain SS14) TaxID=990650 RepID=A0A0C9UDQ4_SPHS4|nr:hypothetical protein M422DRAFT_276191 [Sphaerobolus stellatus SS14]
MSDVAYMLLQTVLEKGADHTLKRKNSEYVEDTNLHGEPVRRIRMLGTLVTIMWPFKHDRIDVERRLRDIPESTVTTSDVARLMELFQSSLLKYWQFQPKTNEEKKSKGNDEPEEPQDDREDTLTASTQSHEKKIPSTDTMKCILDAFLVLTKQDRLCHVIHATSDPFYQTWLRQLNVIQHCKIISIGDCSKEETRSSFEDRILPSIPEEYRSKLDFEEFYQCFGGKLAHWSDYIADFVNADGNLPVCMSSHFLQAHALLNLHLLHARSSDPDSGSSQNVGFRIYSPLAKVSPHAAPSPDGFAPDEPELIASFTAADLLNVMQRLTSHSLATPSLPYFALCRELGTHVVDSMVRGRLLELRWSNTVMEEGDQLTRGKGKGKQERVGPQLVPTTPIIGYAMREILKEYGIAEPERKIEENK